MLWRAEVAKSLTYRADLVVGMVVNVLWLAVVLAPVLFVFASLDRDGDGVAGGAGATALGDGWTLGELLYLQALWWLLDAVVWMLIVPNLSNLSTEVADGRLDLVLLKPINSMLYTTNKRLEILDVLKIPMALALAVYALTRTDTAVSAGGVVFGSVAVLAAMVLMWAVGVLANVKALTSVRFDAGWLAVDAHSLSRVPMSFYGTALRLLLSAVVPIAFLTTIPAELMFGDRDWWWALVAVTVAGITVALAQLAWNHQVRRYSGAMS